MNRNKKIENASRILNVLARKERMGKEDAESAELAFLCHFDSIARKECRSIGRNAIGFHTIVAIYVASLIKSDALKKLASDAYDVLIYATGRSRDVLIMTSGEVHIYRQFQQHYFKILPNVDSGIVADCVALATEIFKGSPMEGAA